jgi:hypothetical protein
MNASSGSQFPSSWASHRDAGAIWCIRECSRPTIDLTPADLPLLVKDGLIQRRSVNGAVSPASAPRRAYSKMYR